MDFLPPVVAKLIADVGEFNAAMGASQAKLEGMAAANAKLAAAGKVAMAGLAVAVAAIGFESVKLAQNFDQTMELIHTQAGAAQSEVDGLKNKVLDLAPAVGIGPEKLAEGLYHIESTGFRGKEALDILAASAKLAAMGLADLDTVTFAMSGVMSVAMKDVTSAADATNYLNTIVGMGDMKMEKLAAAIGTGVLPSFKSAGLGMKDFGASLATITDNSVGADEAATRLRMTVSLMAAPSHAATKALESIGIGQMQLAEDLRQPNGLLVAVEDLKRHLEESGKTASEQNAVISKAFGGGRSSSAILTLLEESDRLKSKYEQLGTSASRAAKADEAWKQQQKQFKQQLHEVGAELQVIGVKIGEFLIPYIQKSAEWLSKHTGAVKVAALVIGSVLVAAMMAFTYSVIANTVAMLANPVTWIVLGIVAAIALLAFGIYELVKHWDTVWGWIKRISLNVWHWLVDAWNWTWDQVMQRVHWVKDNIIDPIVHFFDKYLLEPVKAALKVISAEWALAWGFLSVILDHFGKNWDALWSMIVAIAKWAWDTFLKPTFDNINEYGVKPVRAAMKWLGDEWSKDWNAISNLASAVWNKGIKPTFDNIDKYAIKPIGAAVDWLGGVWSRVWGAIGAIIEWTWQHVVKPVIDKFNEALDGLKRKWNDVTNAPGKAGSALAHLIPGFADGGWVPGSAGAPQLAVVHGGEYVLSQDMIAAGRGPGLSSPVVSSASAGHAEANARPYVIENRLYVDGRELHVALIPHAQRYKARNGTTGLS